MIKNKEDAIWHIQILDHYNSMIQEIEKLGLIKKLVSKHHMHGHRIKHEQIRKN